tara:strand:- start:4089 stop:4808 length:720 start_codon:yes stop_codon:yes gene_type:complete
MSVNKNGYEPVWNLYSTTIISFIIFVTFTLAQSIILFLIQKIHSNQAVDLNSLAYNYLGVISFFSSICGCICVYFFIKIKNFELKNYLNINYPSFKISLKFFAFTVAFILIMELISNLYPSLFDTDFVRDSYKNSNNLIFFYFGVVLLGPLFEELLFRGFLFKGFENSFVGGHGAVFISSFIFSIIHVQYGFYIIVFLLFPMSLLLGYARLESGSILLPIFLHSFNNLVTSIITHFQVY